MTATQICKTARAALILAIALLFALALQASDTQSSDVGKGFAFVYDPSQETTVEGTVQEIITHPASGSAVGIHLLVSSDGKTIDAHLGPFLSTENREALVLGEAVKIVGVNASHQGQKLFLVRQLTVGERQVIIRNQRGFLVREVPQRRAQINKTAVNGGAQ